jgi:uncharacterized membrane protein YoaK (UPF0700 family)
MHHLISGAVIEFFVFLIFWGYLCYRFYQVRSTRMLMAILAMLGLSFTRWPFYLSHQYAMGAISFFMGGVCVYEFLMRKKKDPIFLYFTLVFVFFSLVFVIERLI